MKVITIKGSKITLTIAIAVIIIILFVLGKNNLYAQENSIPPNVIDDIMRKNQQFAYTLGGPYSDILPSSDSIGYYQKFLHGYIFWHPQFGAHEVHGGISDKWNSFDRESGELGYPTSDEHDVEGGRQSDFEKGSIRWSEENGEITVFLNK